MMKYISYCITFISLVLTLLILSCINLKMDKPPGRLLNRELTSAEASLPSVKYQLDFTVGKTGLIGLSPHDFKPQVEWSKENKTLDINRILVDSEGGVFFAYIPIDDTSDLLTTTKLIRLNPDGSDNWVRNVHYMSHIEPLLVTESSLIIYDRFGDHLCFECIALNGDTIWRSDLVDTNITYPKAWLISDSRILFPATSENPAVFYTIGLKSGDIKNKITLTGWECNNFEIPKPIELDDSSWIFANDTSISHFDEKFTPIWQHQVQTDKPMDFNSYCVVASDDYVFYSSSTKLTALEIQSGEIFWSKGSDEWVREIDRIYKSAGIIDDNLLSFSKSEDYKLSAYDFTGNPLWSVPDSKQNSYYVEMVIYENGDILYGHSKGIRQIDSAGNVIWQLNLSDLGIKLDASVDRLNICPSPEERIVIGVKYFDGTKSHNKIISLK